MIRREEALEYHAGERAGKIAVHPLKPCLTAREMRLAYMPGAAFACEAIAGDPGASFRYTARANLVGVITDGSAVPGLGAIGPAAAKPMQEGLALLFKRLADIDAFDLEIAAPDPDAFIETVRQLEPTFGAIVLKDLRAPDGLRIYERLCETLAIPVYHENLQSTAVVATAALMNALELVDKHVGEVRVVMAGAGTVGIGCARLFRLLGVEAGRLWLYDLHGLIHPDRTDLTTYKREFARADAPPTLAEALRGADVFVGASAGSVLTADHVRTMARYPIVLALAMPDPEITYEEARASRHDVIVGTALSGSPNAVVDLLSFPYVLRGALDVHATRISDGMLLAAARALADLAREEVADEVSRAYGAERFSFGPEYILPKPIDARVLVREAAAVAAQAIADGVARQSIDVRAYQDALPARLGAGRELMRRLTLKARRERPRVVFAEGSNETVLRAAGLLVDESIARPVLLGAEAEIRSSFERLGLDGAGVTIVDPSRSVRRDAYVEQLFSLRSRRGVMRATAADRLRHADYFGAMMVHCGDAEMLVAGLSAHYVDSLRTILEVVGVEPGVRRVASYYVALLPRETYFLADCAVNIDPDAEALAEIALLTARSARALGVEPRVAMLSFSNFGSVDHAFARKVRHATEIAKTRAPELTIDGEMQLATALSADIRTGYFPFAELKSDANVLIFPDLQSGNLAMHLLQYVGDAVVVGPVLTGTRCPAHLLQYGSTVEEVVNLTVTGIVQASALKGGEEETR
jgi:malate dehydrogenase (oxaloacetate-decarboxylating)(NADP+)